MPRISSILLNLIALLGIASSENTLFNLSDSGAATCPAASPVAIKSARSDIECAAVCAASDTCKSWNHVPAIQSCMMSERDNCSWASGNAAFRMMSLMLSCQSRVIGPMSAGTTVQFMQRFDGSVSFAKPWADYDAGFGDCGGEFWLGLRYIKTLLGSSSATWRVEMKTWAAEDLFVEYSGFTVGDASTKYLMNYVAMANKSAAVTYDAMSTNHNTAFSTMDRDNDITCSTLFNGQGGFWLGNCGGAYTTAIYPFVSNTNAGYMRWHRGSGYSSLKEIRMYLKR